MKKYLVYALWCGWILTIPPPATNSFITDLNLGEWIQVAAFDTANECEQARIDSYVKAHTGKSPDWVKQGYAAAQCRAVCKCEKEKE